LLGLAQTHTASIFPVITHTQFAQPTTLGHYLMATVEFLERDLFRLRQSYHTVNCCPLGACVATTTGFPLTAVCWRACLALMPSLKSLWMYRECRLSHARAWTLTTLMVGKFIQDLLLWCSQDLGLLVLPDGFCTRQQHYAPKTQSCGIEHLRILASNSRTVSSRDIGSAQYSVRRHCRRRR
jgi:argininosuccinate lyase